MQSPRKTRYTRAVAAALVAVACASAGAADKYVLISHAPDSDSWWNTIKNAIKQAGEDFGVEVDYRNPPNGDLADMARLIEQGAARNYNGVITSIADYDVLKSAMGKVTAKKIPLITINSGTTQQSESLGAIMHVGQPEYEAGKGAGMKAKAAGIKSFVCVDHQATNDGLMQRCKGFADAIGADISKSLLDTGEDPVTVESKVSAYLRNNPGTQAILTVGPSGAVPTLKALEKAGKYGKIWLATFDLTPEISAAIKNGGMQFAIDQQPYLQGYIPVAVMAIMKRDKTTDIGKVQAALKADKKFAARLAEYGLAPAYGPRHIGSGPGFVTKENIGKVEQYAGQYR
ncbi:sugar ABC transporter substrate-binding protein [Chitinimonas sp.]|uniref:sugar ABC transporter substrate-binding protein n=1 Tax=Chitinimonas sp. TaxID=1934313 RepID=UPI002F91D8A6